MFLKLTDADGLWSKIKNHVGVKVKHPISPASRELRARINDPGVKKTSSVCPYCSAIYGMMNSPYRWTKVKYRRPYSDHWEELSLDEAMDMIADRVKKTRDETWEDENEEGKKLSRSMAVASVGGATIDNEENYLITKLFHSMGFVRITNQARI